MIAAENDGVGTVGVAFGTSITGVEILGLTSDAAIVQSMAQQHNFDVVNHSWGFVVPFADSQLSSNAAWSSFFASFPDAVQTGRGGLGTVIVHSAGNDRTNQFNSGLARDTNDSNFTGLPPEKWSSLMYGLWPDGGLKNGKEATHCGRDRHEAAAG